MRKKILTIFLLFLLLGCKKIEKNNNYIELVTNCLNDKGITNNVSLGYKYYVPKGVKKIKDFDNNQIFLINGSKVYLYIDVISYFYNKEIIILSKSPDDFYYHEIEYKDKKGYIKIKENKNEKYFVSIVYDYAKAEFYSSKEDLQKIITLTSIMLNNIKYNDSVIEKVLEGELGQFSEFTYELEKPEDASSNFSQYLEEYVQKDETEQLPGE